MIVANRRCLRANRTPPTRIVGGLNRQGKDAADLARTCLLLAHSRHGARVERRPLSEPKRTSVGWVQFSVYSITFVGECPFLAPSGPRIFHNLPRLAIL